MAKQKTENAQQQQEIEGVEASKSPVKAQKKKLKKEKLSDSQVSVEENSSNKRKRQSEKLGRKKFKPEIDSLVYRVVFPVGGTCYKDALMKVFDSCQTVLRPHIINITFASKEEAEIKAAELEKITLNDCHLIVRQSANLNVGNPFKRVISLGQTFKETDELKKFYDAEHVEQVVSAKGNLSNKFILTFGSEAKAYAASKKLFAFRDTHVELQVLENRDIARQKSRQEKKIQNEKFNGDKNAEQAQDNKKPKRNRRRKGKRVKQEKAEEKSDKLNIDVDQDD